MLKMVFIVLWQLSWGPKQIFTGYLEGRSALVWSEDLTLSKPWRDWFLNYCRKKWWLNSTSVWMGMVTRWKCASSTTIKQLSGWTTPNLFYMFSEIYIAISLFPELVVDGRHLKKQDSSPLPDCPMHSPPLDSLGWPVPSSLFDWRAHPHPDLIWHNFTLYKRT